MLDRPEPILIHDARPVKRSDPLGKAAEALLVGQRLIVADRYSTGTAVLAQLRRRLNPPPQEASHELRHAFRIAYREASLRLLAPVRDHRLALQSAPPVPFLKELYPELSSFVLPFDELRRLKAAWRFYDEGVHLPVLGHRLHPYWGTYVPARMTHLELFATWLSAYQGRRGLGVDVGTGSGVLALMLARSGFERVEATDLNPNAVESVRRELERLPDAPPIALHCADLLGPGTQPADLVVFNPPWVQGEVGGMLDRALYFEAGLFERFFDLAVERLAPDGRIALVFSDLIRLVQPDLPHPIEVELERGRLELVQKLRRKVPPTTTREGKRLRTKERVEVWELKAS